MKKKIKALMLCIVMGTALCYGQSIETLVKVTGIRSDKGQLKLTIFEDGEGFDKSSPLKNLVFGKMDVSDGKLLLSFKLKAGTYGIILLDDENSNGKMDKNFLGIPKEGYGFSNSVMKAFGRPSFDDFKFTISPGSNLTAIRVKYF